MFSSLLFFPIVGGFYFVSVLHLTHIKAKRADGYRLVFYALGAGLGLFALSLLVCPLILSFAGWSSLFGSLVEWSIDFVTVSGSYTALWSITDQPSHYQILVGIVSVALGIIISHMANLTGRFVPFLGKEFAVELAINERGDSMEWFLAKALNSGDDVLVTMESNKVYIGDIVRNINPAYDLLSIAMRLRKSGFRKETDHTVVITTDYDKIDDMIAGDLAMQLVDKLSKADLDLSDDVVRNLAESMLDDYKSSQIIEEKLVVIPFQDIQSIHLYDRNVFEMHQRALKKDQTAVEENTQRAEA